jgi:hypothetical protein
LAAYVMLIIAASAYIILNSKHPIRNAVIWGFFIFLVYIFFSTLNDGDNIINNLIFNRLRIEDEGLAGNNRFTPDLDILFDKTMNSKDGFWGIGITEYSKYTGAAGAGYKVFITQHGIIGVLLVFLLYIFIVFSNVSKMAWIFFLVYILCFLQAAYPLWECELLIFITAMPMFKNIINNTRQCAQLKLFIY